MFSKLQHSALLSRVHGHGDKANESKLYRTHGMKRWRQHQPLFGRQDVIIPRSKLAVFVDGCFWHGCPKHATQPKGNRRFWAEKLEANKSRDRKVNRELRAKGWRVLRIWEHDLKVARYPYTVRRVERALA
ncbi:MAG: DNA mismatch endonuclease Vsr [Flavobacteriales bacterium]|nr:DNA mismatch endonuclease Vsr [Flavobacteriales bacterium]